TVNPDRRGTKVAAWYRLNVGPGQTAQLRLRLRPEGSGPDAVTALGADFTRVEAQRRDEADEFYGELTPPAASAGHAAGVRRHVVEQAVLQLQRCPLAGRRREPTAAPGAAAERPQRPMAQLRGVRRHVDARYVG